MRRTAVVWDREDKQRYSADSQNNLRPRHIFTPCHNPRVVFPCAPTVPLYVISHATRFVIGQNDVNNRRRPNLTCPTADTSPSRHERHDGYVVLATGNIVRCHESTLSSRRICTGFIIFGRRMRS